MKALTHSLLLIGLSPEQISGRMGREKNPHEVSRTTIYSLVARSGWQHLLARKGKTYRKGTKASAGARLIPNRVDISERPSSVDDKQEVGHCEADTAYGQDGDLVSLVERVSKLLLTCRVKNKSKQAVTQTINGLLKPFMSHWLSITFDNGGSLPAMRRLKRRSNAIPLLPGLIILGSGV